MEKIGIFIVDGLREAYDVMDHNKLAFGEKLVMMEFVSMHSFRPMQQYVDNYKRFSENSYQECGINCNLLFAESLSGTLMSEFSVDFVCATAWRMKSEAQKWYDSALYQRTLLPIREEYSQTLAVLLPIQEGLMPWQLQAAAKQHRVLDVLKAD